MGVVRQNLAKETVMAETCSEKEAAMWRVIKSFRRSLCKGKPTTCLSPSWHQAHCPHLSQASTHQPGPGECLSHPVVQLGNQGAEGR